MSGAFRPSAVKVPVGLGTDPAITAAAHAAIGRMNALPRRSMTRLRNVVSGRAKTMGPRTAEALVELGLLGADGKPTKVGREAGRLLIEEESYP